MRKIMMQPAEQCAVGRRNLIDGHVLSGQLERQTFQRI